MENLCYRNTVYFTLTYVCSNQDLIANLKIINPAQQDNFLVAMPCNVTPELEDENFRVKH